MIIKPTLDRRSELYYRKWQYVVSFGLDKFFITRRLDPHAVNYHQNISGWRFASMTPEHLNDVRSWISFMRSTKYPFKQVCGYNWGYVYTNDKQLVDDICVLPYLKTISVKEALICRPTDSIVLANSPYRLRTYMRDLRLNSSDVPALSDYVLSQPWRVGPGFEKMLLESDGRYHYCRRYYFVDHNDERDTMLLNMITPGIVGRTLPIVSG
jgi:hypothetical protein